jgi:hypothetical protein
MIENRAQYLENRKTGRVTYEALVANDVKVRVYGDTAIVTYLSTAKGKDPLGAIDDQRSFTRVFVRQDGRWQRPSGAPERGRPRKTWAPIPATRLTSNASWRSWSRISIALSSGSIPLSWSETYARITSISGRRSPSCALRT